MRNWLSNDDPWFEHTRWFPKCPFVVLVKGQAYIRNVLERTQNTTQGNTIQGTITTQPPFVDQSSRDAHRWEIPENIFRIFQTNTSCNFLRSNFTRASTTPSQPTQPISIDDAMSTQPVQDALR